MWRRGTYSAIVNGPLPTAEVRAAAPALCIHRRGTIAEPRSAASVARNGAYGAPSVNATSYFPFGSTFAIWLNAAPVGRGRFGRHQPLEPERDVLGLEGAAVVKRDALAQLEGPGQAILGERPGFGQARHDLQVLVEHHEALVGQVAPDLGSPAAEYGSRSSGSASAAQTTEPPGFGGPRTGAACTPGLPAAAGVWAGFGSGVCNGATGVVAPERAGLVGCWQAASRSRCPRSASARKARRVRRPWVPVRGDHRSWGEGTLPDRGRSQRRTGTDLRHA